MGNEFNQPAADTTGPRRPTYMHELDDWPDFRWDPEAIGDNLQRANALARQERALIELTVMNITDSAVASSQIEGEYPDPAAVRAAILRRMVANYPWNGRDSAEPGTTAMMANAAAKYRRWLTIERLHTWHGLLFPEGDGVGRWRDHAGPAWAPSANRLNDEVRRFLGWFNSQWERPDLTKAAVAHLWFVTIHPYQDGNGRIARAISDVVLARCDGMASRFYNTSAEILRQRDRYYEELAAAQTGSMDITAWMLWFLDRLIEAFVNTPR